MAANLTQTLKRLSEKCDTLAARYEELAALCKSKDETIDELTQQAEKLRIELQNASLDNQYLRLSHKIAPSRGQVNEGKALIAGLVREIDRCILLLKE